MQGTPVLSTVQEYPTSRGATQTADSRWATTTEPVLKSLEAATTEAHALRPGAQQREKPPQ